MSKKSPHNGIFDKLAIENGGEEISNELKDKFIDSIDTPKNQEGYYLDAFNQPISFNGIRQLKRPYTKLALSKFQQDEIIACQNDYFYFRRNYCKILTKAGVGRPEPRDYQKRLENELVKGDDVIAFFPRQCCSSETIITINDVEITFKDLFDEFDSEKLNSISENISEKFIKSIDISDKNKFIETPNGKVKILQIHKTIPLKKYRIELDNGMFLEGAEFHVVITEDYEEIHIRDSIDSVLITDKGLSKVINVIDLNIEENMYDISIDSNDELYFSNGILSHNSGKTVTIATYLLHCALFRKNINIGIAANVMTLAAEVLDKIKKIYIELPIYLQAGMLAWNKRSMELDNGNKIMIAASNGDAFRGFSLSVLYVDETGFINNNLFEEFMDSVMPAMAAIQDSQAIFSSTANGLNHFYFMVEGARKNAKIALGNDDAIQLEDGRIMSPEEYYIYKQSLKKPKEVLDDN